MKSNHFQERKSPNFILILYLTVAAFVLIAAPFLASHWNQQPFIGGFVTPAMQFRKFSNLLSDEAWPIQELGFSSGESLIAIDGEPVGSAFDISNILSNYQPGDSVSLTILSEAQETYQVQITLISFSNIAKFIYIFLPLFIAVLCLLSGLWVYSDLRKRKINMAFTAFSTSIAVMLSTYYDFYTTQQLVPIFFISIGIAAGSLIQITFLLPWHDQFQKKMPWLNYAAYPYNILLMGIAIFQLQNPSETVTFSECAWMLIISLAFSAVVFIVSSSVTIFKLASPVFKRRSEILIAAAAISFVPLGLFFLIGAIHGSEVPINPLFFPLLCVLPITYTHQIRRFLLPQTRIEFFHSFIYLLISIVFGFLYMIVIVLLNHVFKIQIFSNNPLIIGILVFLVVFIIDPIQKVVKRTLVAPSSSSEWGKTLAINFSSSLTAITNPDIAVDLLKDILEKVLNPRHVHIYLYDPQIPGFVAKPDLEYEREEELIAPYDSVIATTIEKLRDILYFRVEDNGAKNPKSQVQLWDEYGSCIFAPIPGSFGIHGWVAMGPKLDGVPYSADDIDLIGTLTHQFSMVYERVDAMTTTRKRLHEMEILNHIAAAINSNNDFDDLLLSTYKEIKSIIPIDRFSLVMDSEIKGFYNRLFLFENGKKIISTSQPKPLQEEFIEKSGIENGKPEIVQSEGVWLVVPLTADEQNIGAISLGHLSEKAIFDLVDLNLVNSIASLVNGAIIKASLLRASQQQAHQLATLNRVSQQLTSTLVLETLLKNILNGAIEILNSSSGILMIADKTGDSLEFRVIAGAIEAGMRGEHVSVNKGIAGESYMTKKPVIKNVVDRDKLWGRELSQITKSRIDNVLAVPLIARGVVIGVIEIINKKNKVSFDQNDVNLLEGFANQAAIAIHNATLYTQTDRALESRIEELYIMQKIDRDLNSTRDIDQALQVMLTAAITHTHASAGSIGMTDGEANLLEKVYQVLPDMEEPDEKCDIKLEDFPWLPQDEDRGYRIEESQGLSTLLGVPEELGEHYLIHSKLNESKSALLILHMDSSTAINQEDLEFLTRLSDHAMIALKNIYLYQELHEAIETKNEFISFISHELKNPLTVIKGYADILRKGMAGDVTEEQADFLNTITHNVRQMSTFITDLSDQSQIETKSLRLIFEQTSIIEVINEVLHTYENQIKEKSLNVQVEVNKEIPDVWCDRLRLIQILSNLVSNAVKYTPEGGCLKIGAQHAVNAWDDKGAAEVVHVWAEDNGYGISSEDQEHLFEKFFRGSNKRIGKIPGSGLGLMISKTLVEMMGGKMWFESSEGEGSIFHFTVPI